MDSEYYYSYAVRIINDITFVNILNAFSRITLTEDNMRFGLYADVVRFIVSNPNYDGGRVFGDPDLTEIQFCRPLGIASLCSLGSKSIMMITSSIITLLFFFNDSCMLVIHGTENDQMFKLCITDLLDLLNFLYLLSTGIEIFGVPRFLTFFDCKKILYMIFKIIGLDTCYQDTPTLSFRILQNDWLDSELNDMLSVSLAFRYLGKMVEDLFALDDLRLNNVMRSSSFPHMTFMHVHSISRDKFLFTRQKHRIQLFGTFFTQYLSTNDVLRFIDKLREGNKNQIERCSTLTELLLRFPPEIVLNIVNSKSGIDVTKSDCENMTCYRRQHNRRCRRMKSAFPKDIIRLFPVHQTEGELIFGGDDLYDHSSKFNVLTFFASIDEDMLPASLSYELNECTEPHSFFSRSRILLIDPCHFQYFGPELKGIVQTLSVYRPLRTDPGRVANAILHEEDRKATIRLKTPLNKSKIFRGKCSHSNEFVPSVHSLENHYLMFN